MKKIFVTATNTDIGKTYTTIKLMQQFAKEGLRVAAIKPIETGVETTPVDGMKHQSLQQRLNPELRDITIEDTVPITYSQPAAPFIASGGALIDTEDIFKSVKKFEGKCDILLIEGAGGLFVPINKNYFIIDLIKDFEVDATLLVTHCALGCINDTLLSHKALEDYDLFHTIAFNCKEGDDFDRTSKPYFDAIGFDVLQVDKDIKQIASKLYNL